jgi:hypothetical protein
METKQYMAKKLLWHQRNKVRSKKFWETNPYENTTYQVLCDTS